MYLVTFVDQRLKRTEKSLICSDCDQDVFKRVNFMSHNPTEEFSQTFHKRGVALCSEISMKHWVAGDNEHHELHKHRSCSSCYTYKTSGVLVHRGSATHSFTESFLNKLRRGEVGKSLSKVYWFVVCCQLGEFNPVKS